MWADPSGFRYQPGMLYLGRSPQDGGELGIRTKTHAITIAGSRSGKGACAIIPNLLRWPQNALVIDPKGEAALATAEHREKVFGQEVQVIDPFNRCPLPERFKARFNPLDEITADSPTAREDIRVIVDGLVIASDPRHRHWDDGTREVLAGLIAYVADMAGPSERNLIEVRDLLTLPKAAHDRLIHELETNGACGNLPAGAAARLTRSPDEARHFLSGAQGNTQWLNSPAMRSVLCDSTFRLSDLKTKPCTVYLVLPSEYLEDHGRFLRLFVRAALDAMAKGGTDSGRECLFILDEFYSLGPIDVMTQAAGRMPGYGVKLWPILQDVNQLVALYDKAAGTFFANSGLWQFFGNTDQETLALISARLGVKTAAEVSAPPETPIGSSGLLSILQEQADKNHAAAVQRNTFKYVTPTNYAGGMLRIAGVLNNVMHQTKQAAHQDAISSYQHEMATVGKPRLPPDEIRQLVQVKSDIVADHAICFCHGADNLLVKPQPFFRDNAPDDDSNSASEAQNSLHTDPRRTEKTSNKFSLTAFDFIAAGFVTLLWVGLGRIIIDYAGLNQTVFNNLIFITLGPVIYFKILRDIL